MDKTQFDLRINEAKLYIEQGLGNEADALLEGLLTEINAVPYSDKHRSWIDQVNSLKSDQKKAARKTGPATAQTQPKKTAEDLFLEASVLKDLESYEEAIRNYKTLIKHDYKLHDSLLALISCYKRLNALKNAEVYLAALIKDPASSAAKKDFCYYFQSFILEEKSDFMTAMEMLNSVASPKNFHDFDNRKKALQSKVRGRTKFDYLLAAKQISKADLQSAETRAKREQKSIEHVLISFFKVPMFEMGKSLSLYYGYPFIDLSKEAAGTHPELFAKLKYEYLRSNHWAPLSASTKGDKIKIVIDSPDIHRQGDINKIFIGKKIEFIIAIREQIDSFIDQQFESPTEETESQEEDVSDFLDGISTEFDADFDDDDDQVQEDVQLVDNKVIMFVNKMIIDATRKRASDIHIEPSTHSKNADIRFRVDGMCQLYIKIPNSFCRPVVSRIKIMAKMDITEKRKPRDGKIKFKSKSTGAIELRVATIPTSGGKEDVVLRVLRSGKPMPLKDLGVLDYVAASLYHIIHKPYGLILVVGPTGSGKTTTLHSALNVINTPEKKIWTAEDPVEIDQKGIRQSEVHAKIGVDFAALLRSFLRADPDVIMVGEMRDEETIKTGIEASLTGHLVFSTLHTNNAPETVTRLLEMGVDPTNFADSLLGILAQRLGRTLCDSCKEPVPDQKKATDELINEFGDDPLGMIEKFRNEKTVIYQPKGCAVCDNTGYYGRIGFHEFLMNHDKIRKLIKADETTEKIKLAAVKNGMCTLKQDGILKVIMGVTDLAEVKRNCI